MNMQKALKVRLYPTPKQAIFLNKMLGCCRFLYNHMLAEWIQVYEALFEFLKEVDAFAVQQAWRNLESAYANFFNLRRGKKRKEAETLFFPFFLFSFFLLEQAAVKRSKPNPLGLGS
jgi:transposase